MSALKLFVIYLKREGWLCEAIGREWVSVWTATRENRLDPHETPSVLQHIFNCNAVPARGIVDENVRDGADNFAVL